MNAETLQELAALRACGARHGWRQIGRHLGVSWQTARGQWRRKCQGMAPGPCPLCGGVKGKTSWKVRGNYATATAQAHGALSLDEFQDLLKVDRDVWRVLDWEAGTWQQNVNRRGELKFTASILDGHLEYSPEIVDLWSHRAKFIRREPVAVAPAVQPVACPVTYDVPRSSDFRPPAGAALLASDLHVGYRRDNRTGQLEPFHDRRAIDVLFQLLAVGGKGWDFVGILGDLLDLTNWNDKYSRSPDYYWTTQPAILEAHWILRKVRELAPKAEIVLLMGNHENRIKRSLEKHLIEAYDLRAADEMHLPPALSPEKLLALDSLGIDWVNEYPSGEVWLGPLRLTHGEIARKPPGASARAVLDDTDCDNAFGHTHRLELVSKRVRTAAGVRVVKALSTGCLCHTDGRVPPQGSPEHWQKGLATVSYTPDLWSPTLIGLAGGWAVAGGQEYIGQDYTEELRADLPDWNW